MGTWQLYVDESGKFDTSEEDLVVAGVLVEGYATPQLDDAMKSALARIFVGVPYPAHAAHHNLRASLLWGPLRGETASGPSAARFDAATEPTAAIVRGDRSPACVEFLAAVRDAATTKDIRYEALRGIDRWLERHHPGAFLRLAQEAQQQRSELAAFLAQGFPTVRPARRVALVAAFQEGTGIAAEPSRSAGDRRYAGLYEALLERAAAFVAERDRASRLWVHVAERGAFDASHTRRLNAAQDVARAHPLLGRAHSPPEIVRPPLRDYDTRVPPGIVLADFAANAFRRHLRRTASWRDVANNVEGHLGIAPEARCPLITSATMLPSIETSGPIREMLRLVCAGHAAPIPPGPRWAQEQARLWMDALAAEGAR